MMEKYDINKTVKQLRKVAKDSPSQCEGTIFLIANELRLYNELIELFNQGDTARGYTIYQIGISIFKHLAAFGQVPIRQKEEPKQEPTFLSEVIAKVNQL